MKKQSKSFRDVLGPAGLGAVLMASSLSFAAPLDSKANSCTFVDAVVSASRVFGTADAVNNRAAGAAGTETDIVVQKGAVRVPAGAAGLSNCGVVHFATEADSASEIGAVRTTTQKYLQMATIFENQNNRNADLISIFDFVRPIVGVGTVDKP